METALIIRKPQIPSSSDLGNTSSYIDLGILPAQPVISINSVADAFRVATLTIEMETSSSTGYMISVLTSQASTGRVPEYFENISTPDAGALYRFLVEHQDMMEIIVFSCSEAFKKFSHNSKLSLEICYDESEEYLALMVRQKTYQKTLMKMIDEISEKFEDLLVSRSGWFMITTDFNRPD
jgi:hypothetical protein